MPRALTALSVVPHIIVRFPGVLPVLDEAPTPDPRLCAFQRQKHLPSTFCLTCCGAGFFSKVTFRFHNGLLGVDLSYFAIRISARCVGRNFPSNPKMFSLRGAVGFTRSRQDLRPVANGKEGMQRGRESRLA